jgi:hypothetical protein
LAKPVIIQLNLYGLPAFLFQERYKMRIFEHPNLTNFICPICGTSDDKQIVLIPISGTQDGGNMQARQYHLDCIDIWEYKFEGENNYYICQNFKEDHILKIKEMENK